MLLEKNHIYHIYNQGNNRQKIFFNRENQLFFLQKMNDYLLPYCDIMAWCLMPNHFHWMVYVRQTELEIVDSQGGSQSIDKVGQSASRDDLTESRGATQSRTPTTSTKTKISPFERDFMLINTSIFNPTCYDKSLIYIELHISCCLSMSKIQFLKANHNIVIYLFAFTLLFINVKDTIFES